jgi:hypothetical protein
MFEMTQGGGGVGERKRRGRKRSVRERRERSVGRGTHQSRRTGKAISGGWQAGDWAGMTKGRRNVGAEKKTKRWENSWNRLGKK